jgi:hypothetical protein
MTEAEDAAAIAALEDPSGTVVMPMTIAAWGGSRSATKGRVLPLHEYARYAQGVVDSVTASGEHETARLYDARRKRGE